MSKQALANVVQRSINDGSFRRQLATDPTGALRGYDLTDQERAALRSRDTGRLTAFGIELRMSKAFSFGGNEAGNSVLTSDLTASGAVQSPDAADRNLLSAGSSVQSPDAADRNFLSADSSVQSPDAIDRNLAFTGEESAAGAVQSPDAADRNVLSAGSSVQSPDAADRNLEYLHSGSGTEPRDVAPTDIGDYQPLSGAIGGTELSPAMTDEGFETHVGYDDGVAPEISPAIHQE